MLIPAQRDYRYIGLDVKGKCHGESGEVLEQAAQRGCGCSIPGGVQNQDGWSPGQPGLLSHLRLVALSVRGGLKPDDPWGLFQPKSFHDWLKSYTQSSLILGVK